MKWLKFLKAAKKRTLEGGAEPALANDAVAAHKHKDKRRSMQHERKERTSIEQWHEARKTRTSIDICSALNVPTTERLSVCKAGITLLINRTYIVIKHLGSGSSGQVKLAFNLRSKKLVAIKAVRKGGSSLLGCRDRDRDTRSVDGRGGVASGPGGLGFRQLPGGLGGGGGSHSVSVDGMAGGDSGGGGGGGRGWRSLAPSSMLRRSASSRMGSWSGATSTAPASAASPSPLGGSAAAAAASAALAAAPAAAATTAPPPQAAAARCPVEELVREIAILKRLSHPNVVQLLEVIDDPASDCLLLVMGYVEGSTLQPPQLAPGRWRPVPEATVWRHARDVLCGLEYLHCHGVVHGDLKPANFIQDSLTGVVRILDFGSAVLTGRMMGGGEEGLRGAHVPMSCTPGFRSPESLAAGYRPGFQLDMWALGVCLYLWVFGELPFKGSAPFVVYENIRSAPLALPTHTSISAQLRDLITRLLDKDPARRCTVHEVVAHPWTTAQGLAPLRTTSPHVMAARMQLASAAAGAAGVGGIAGARFLAPSAAAGVPPPPAKAQPAPAPAPLPPLHHHHSQRQHRQELHSAALVSGSNSSFNLASSVGVGGDAASDASDAGRGGGAMLVDAPGEPWLASAASAPPALACSAVSRAVDGRPPPPQPPAGRDPWVGSAVPSAAAPAPAPAPPASSELEEGPWRMSAYRAGPAASGREPSPPWFASSLPYGPGAAAGVGPMPGIAESSTGNTCASLHGGGSAAAAFGDGSGRRGSSEAWELRRSVTEEELQAAISSCADATGSAAVLMESIFSEVTFPAKQQIIRAGDPLDRIYLITAGEVEIYHDLTRDGPDAPCPDKPIIEGLSDPESDLDDPADFLSIRLPGLHRAALPQLERLSTGLLNATGGVGGDRSNHGGTHGLAAGGGGGGGAAAAAAAARTALTAGDAGGGSRQGLGHLLTSDHSGGAAAAAAAAGGGSIGALSRATTSAGHFIVATKGPGDSLGFAGMLPTGCGCGRGGGGGSGEAGRQPVWSANVRARTQVTAFVASIDSLHRLVRTHPQVEPLLQQMAVQQETDLAVAEAMRSLRLIGSSNRTAAAGGGSGAGSQWQHSGCAAGGGASGADSASDARAPSSAVARMQSLPHSLAAGAAAAAAAAALARGVSSEGENDSCGTACTAATSGTSGTGLAALSSADPALLPRLALFTTAAPTGPVAAGAAGGGGDAGSAAALPGQSCSSMVEEGAEPEAMDML